MLEFKKEYFQTETNRHLYPTTLDISKCEVFGCKEREAFMYKIPNNYYASNAGNIDFSLYPNGVWNDYTAIKIVERLPFFQPSINFNKLGDITPSNLNKLKEEIRQHIVDLETAITESVNFIDSGVPGQNNLPYLPEGCVWFRDPIIKDVIALPITDLYGKFNQMVEEIREFLLKLLDKDYNDTLLKFLENVKKELERQLSILAGAGSAFKPKQVANIEILKNVNAKVDEVYEVLGYYRFNDGAGHKRIISNKDDGSGVQLTNELWANIVHNGEVNVSWFGAKGDGVTDDTSFVQKVLNLNNVVNLKFNKGIYNIKFLNLNLKALKITGDSYLNTVLKFTNTDLQNIKQYEKSLLISNHLSKEQDFDELYIENITFDGNKNNIINFENASTTGLGLGRFYNYKKITLNNSKFCNSFRDALRFINCENIIIKKCIFENAGHYDNLKGANNFITFILEANKPYKQDVWIEECCFDNCIDECIYLNDVSNAFLKNNIFKNIGQYVIEYYLSKATSDKVCNFYFVNNTVLGTGSRFFDGDQINCQVNAFINNNYFDNICGYETVVGREQFSPSFYRMNNIKAQPNFALKDNIIKIKKCTKIAVLDGNSLLENNIIEVENISEDFAFYVRSGNSYFNNNKIQLGNEVLQLIVNDTYLEFFRNKVSTVKKFISSKGKDVYIYENTIDISQGFGAIVEIAKQKHNNIILKNNIINSPYIIDNQEKFGSNIINIQDNIITNFKNYYLSAIKDNVTVEQQLNNITNANPLVTNLKMLSTSYISEKMKQENVYDDYISYMDEKTLYGKEQKEIEKQRMLSYQEALKENPELTYEQFMSVQPMTLNLVEEPQPSEALKKFMDKYL